MMKIEVMKIELKSTIILKQFTGKVREIYQKVYKMAGKVRNKCNCAVQDGGMQGSRQDVDKVSEALLLRW